MGEYNRMCESHMCSAKAEVTVIFKGQIYYVCKGHRKLINKQKKVDNNV